MIRDFGDRTELVLEMWSRVKVTISTQASAAHLRRFRSALHLAGICQDTKVQAETPPPSPRKRKGMNKYIVYPKPVNVQEQRI